LLKNPIAHELSMLQKSLAMSKPDRESLQSRHKAVLSRNKARSSHTSHFALKTLALHIHGSIDEKHARKVNAQNGCIEQR
jgi:hypothetical protein